VDPEGVRFPTFPKGLSELRRATVVRIGQDGPMGDLQPKDPIDERETDPPLLLELDLGRDPGLLPTAGSLAPGSGKVEADAAGEPDQVRVMGRSGQDVVEAHPDLTVRALPEGSAPLTSDPDRRVALLGKGGVIEGDPSLRSGEAVGHDLDEPGLKEVRGPRRIGKEVLDPIDRGLGKTIGDGLHGLALPGEQETEEVGAGVGPSVRGPDAGFPERSEGTEELGQLRGP
jgi:hypothetical protein